MSLLNKYHKYATNSLTVILIITLYIGRKVNISNFWYNQRSNNYLDIVMDFKYLFIVTFSLILFCILYGFKRWNTLLVSVLSLTLGVVSFFNSLVFHRLERVFLMIGLTIGAYAWYKYVKPSDNRNAQIVLTLVFALPILFDHFLISETSGVFMVLYLAITSYFAKKGDDLYNFLVFGLLGILVLNILVMIIQIWTGHSLGLTLLGEAILNIQSQKGLATDFINGRQFIRGYGLFGHPNIIGFVGSVSLLFFVFSTFANQRIRQFGLFFSACLMFLSFSRIAWVSGLFISWYVLDLHKISQKIKLLLLTFGSFIPAFLFISRYRLSDIYRFADFQKYTDAYSNTTMLQKFFGVGLGAYPFYLKNQFSNLENWQYEPVHNSLLLIFIEFGGLSLLILVVLLYMLYFMQAKKKDR
jgi:hypothetical protein